MARGQQDRTGNLYEQDVAEALAALGVVRLTGRTLEQALEARARLLADEDGVEGDEERLYFVRPPKARERGGGKNGSKTPQAFFPGTHIQPDLVVLRGGRVFAVIYVTHWSNARDCKRKFWRTWEEYVDQLASMEEPFLSINVVFEALEGGHEPVLALHGSELPRDTSTGRPAALAGWDASISGVLADCFDASVILALGWAGNDEKVRRDRLAELLKKALVKIPKVGAQDLQATFSTLKREAGRGPLRPTPTCQRDRRGFLLAYIAHRLAMRTIGDGVGDLKAFLTGLKAWGDREVKLNFVHQDLEGTGLAAVETGRLEDWFRAGSRVAVRAGEKGEHLIQLREIEGDVAVRMNGELARWLRGVEPGAWSEEFAERLERAFERFDQGFGVQEALEDLVDEGPVRRKADFVFERLLVGAHDRDGFVSRLLEEAMPESGGRKAVSSHTQNWTLEMALYGLRLNSAEHIQKPFAEAATKGGNWLKQHAPFGGPAQTVASLIQGRDVCEQWGSTSKRRWMSPEEFRELCWRTMGECMVDAFLERGGVLASKEEVIRRYLEAKSARILNGDLNPFLVLVESMLGDLCVFPKKAEPGEATDAEDKSGFEVGSVFTEIGKRLYKARPLTTRFEGRSRDGKWLIKCQSSQDGHESDKTKELAGRARAIQLRWVPREPPEDSSQWGYAYEPRWKLALVLDGEWSAEHKLWLLEAGWDWVGGLEELDGLRKRIGLAAYREIEAGKVAYVAEDRNGYDRKDAGC